MIDHAEFVADKSSIVRSIQDARTALRQRQAMTDDEQRAPTIPAPPPVKSCRCGREYDSAEWAQLPLVGAMDDGVDVLELRNCICTSTIAIRVGDSQ